MNNTSWPSHEVAYAVLPQCHTPRISSTAGGTSVEGRHGVGSVPSVRSRMSSSSRVIASGRSPTVALAATTAPVRRTGSTNNPETNPGMEPVWPYTMPDPARESWSPSPYPEAIADPWSPDCGVVISVSVARDSTSSWPATRNAA